MLLIDKPAGPTSHDVVRTVRRSLGMKRVGHAGTLDPAASGLLVVLAGRATRLARFIGMLAKRYTGTIRFGFETVTDDAEGEPMLRDESWRGRTPGEIEAALARVGAQPTQMPPAVSAKKVEGERAYRMVRRGEEPTLRSVEVTIHELRLSAFDPSAGEAVIVVDCSTGTYVRAIARDVGRALGTRAHLAALRRTAIGAWRVEDAEPLNAIRDAALPLRPMSEAVAHLPAIEVDEAGGKLFRHGRKFESSEAHQGFVAVFERDELLGVGEFREGLYSPVVGLAS